MRRMENTSSSLCSDMVRARAVAQKLYDAFYNSEDGIYGETAATSRNRNRPRNVEVGSRDHLLFIALTSSVDRQRNAYDLWHRAQQARESMEDCYLFDPEKVIEAGRTKVAEALKRLKVSRKHAPDAKAWYSICETFATKWQSDPKLFLKSCDHHAPTALARLRGDCHWSEQESRMVADFPQLRGKKLRRCFSVS